MDLGTYVSNTRQELALAADAGGDDARALAERLAAPLESALRLALLDALSDAADEITLDLAPGSGHLRLPGPGARFRRPPAAWGAARPRRWPGRRTPAGLAAGRRRRHGAGQSPAQRE